MATCPLTHGASHDRYLLPPRFDDHLSARQLPRRRELPGLFFAAIAMMIDLRCAQCWAVFSARRGQHNRAVGRGAREYCGRACAGIARRSAAAMPERVAAKALYDVAYRVQRAAEIKAAKAMRHKATYDPAKAAIERKARSAQHVEYCRRPEYVEWKRGYDREYRAEKYYGEFAECYLLAMDIRAECLTQASDEEIRRQAGTLNKSQQRKRDYARPYSN